MAFGLIQRHTGQNRTLSQGAFIGIAVDLSAILVLPVGLQFVGVAVGALALYKGRSPDRLRSGIRDRRQNQETQNSQNIDSLHVASFKSC